MAALANQIKTEGEQDLYLPWQGSMQSVGAVGRKNAGFARSNVPATAVNGGSAGWMASDGRRNDRSEWTMLSKHQKNDLHRWVIKLPQTRAGVDTISNLVLGRGMSFIHPERDLKKEYQSLMRRHWDPFGKDLLLYLSGSWTMSCWPRSPLYWITCSTTSSGRWMSTTDTTTGWYETTRSSKTQWSFRCSGRAQTVL
jgi:hypothetical protein